MNAREAPGLCPLLVKEGQGEAHAFDLAASPLGFGPGQAFGLDLVGAGQHLRIDVDHGASELGVLMLAEVSHRTCVSRPSWIRALP